MCGYKWEEICVLVWSFDPPFRGTTSKLLKNNSLKQQCKVNQGQNRHGIVGGIMELILWCETASWEDNVRGCACMYFASHGPLQFKMLGRAS